MLNKHNVLHKSLYTLHKNDEPAQILKYFSSKMQPFKDAAVQTIQPRRRGRSRPR